MTAIKGQMFKIEGRSYSWNWLIGSGISFSLALLIIIDYCRKWFGNQDVEPIGYWGAAGILFLIGSLFVTSHLSLKNKYIVVDENRLSLVRMPDQVLQMGEFSRVTALKSYRNSSGFTSLYEVIFDTGVKITFGSQTEESEKLASIIQVKTGMIFS